MNPDSNTTRPGLSTLLLFWGLLGIWGLLCYYRAKIRKPQTMRFSPLLAFVATPGLPATTDGGNDVLVAHRRINSLGGVSPWGPSLGCDLPCTVTLEAYAGEGLAFDEVVVSDDSGVTWRTAATLAAPAPGDQNDLAIAVFDSSWPVATDAAPEDQFNLNPLTSLDFGTVTAGDTASIDFWGYNDTGFTATSLTIAVKGGTGEDFGQLTERVEFSYLGRIEAGASPTNGTTADSPNTVIWAQDPGVSTNTVSTDIGPEGAGLFRVRVVNIPAASLTNGLIDARIEVLVNRSQLPLPKFSSWPSETLWEGGIYTTPLLDDGDTAGSFTLNPLAVSLGSVANVSGGSQFFTALTGSLRLEAVRNGGFRVVDDADPADTLTALEVATFDLDAAGLVTNLVETMDRFDPAAAGGGGGSGTVTSVGLTAPGIFTVSGSPVTTSGTLGLTLDTQTEGTFFAGPASAPAAAPGFRAIADTDLPDPIGSLSAVSDTGEQIPFRNGATTYGGTDSTGFGRDLLNLANAGALAALTTGAMEQAAFSGNTSVTLTSAPGHVLDSFSITPNRSDSTFLIVGVATLAGNPPANNPAFTTQVYANGAAASSGSVARVNGTGFSQVTVATFGIYEHVGAAAFTVSINCFASAAPTTAVNAANRGLVAIELP